MTTVPGVGVVAEISAGSNETSVLRLPFAEPDPTARYIVVRAFGLGIQRFGEFPITHRTGFNFHFFCKVRRKADGQETILEVRPSLDLDTSRFGGEHSMVLGVKSYLDHHKYGNIVIDLNSVKAAGYSAAKYDWLGVTGFEITIASCCIVTMTVNQPATWRDWLKTAKDMKTWFPWH